MKAEKKGRRRECGVAEPLAEGEVQIKGSRTRRIVSKKRDGERWAGGSRVVGAWWW